jgi:hypothetical protein
MSGRLAVRSASELQAARQAATKRFLDIASALKAEAGVIGHKVTRGLSGRAWSNFEYINAPEGRTRKQLYILAHECGHVALNHGRNKPAHVKEMDAEKWAHDALRRHGVSVPRSMTKRAKQYVATKIYRAERRGGKAHRQRRARICRKRNRTGPERAMAAGPITVSGRRHHKGARKVVSSPIHLALYLGRDLIGVFVGYGSECEATDAEGRRLGAFDSREAAIAAIWDAHMGDVT